MKEAINVYSGESCFCRLLTYFSDVRHTAVLNDNYYLGYTWDLWLTLSQIYQLLS